MSQQRFAPSSGCAPLTFSFSFCEIAPCSFVCTRTIHSNHISSLCVQVVFFKTHGNVVRLRTSSSVWNVAGTYGPHGELFFFLTKEEPLCSYKGSAV